MNNLMHYIFFAKRLTLRNIQSRGKQGSFLMIVHQYPKEYLSTGLVFGHCLTVCGSLRASSLVHLSQINKRRTFHFIAVEQKQIWSQVCAVNAGLI